MKILRAVIIFALIPLIAGYLVASFKGHKTQSTVSLNVATNNILPTDRITLVEKGIISSITQKGVTSISTNDQQLIETIPLGENYVSVDKQTNYASLLEFSSTGSLTRTLLNGNTNTIDTMNWYTDPAISADQKEIAFVSDRDKDKTDVQDNALFVKNLTTNSVKKIVDPDPHSGGIANPVWSPINPNLITYDYYQYDDAYNPYSVIKEYDISTQSTNPLTTQKQNAYQGSFSPDGKQFIFLERNNDITTTMYIADVTPEGLSHVQQIATGDFAYPKFSNTPKHIYYLQAQENNNYDLDTATIQNNNMTNIHALSTDQELQANSGFTVSKTTTTSK